MIGEVPSVELVCLVDDCVERRGLLAEHGLSVLLRNENLHALIDAGQTSETLFHNAEKLGVDLGTIRDLVITHGHYDHTGSVVELSSVLGPSLRIIADPRAFRPKFIAEQRGRTRHIGIPFKVSEIRSSLSLSEKPTMVSEGIITTGEVERTTDFEVVEEAFLTIEGKRRLRDNVLDEQGVIVNLRGLGLVIVTGCGHPGIINMIRHAQKLTGIHKVYGIVGGLHLRKASGKRIERTVDELRELGLGLVAPCHCTGIRALSVLYGEFRDSFRKFGVGERIQIG